MGITTNKFTNRWYPLTIWICFIFLVGLVCCFFIEPIVIPVEKKNNNGSVIHDVLIIGRPSASSLLRRAIFADLDRRYDDALKSYCSTMTAYDWNKLPGEERAEIKQIVYYRTHGCTEYFRCLASTGFLSRWNKNTLSVFIPKGQFGFSPKTKEMILKAFDQWRQATDIPAVIEITDPKSADLSFIVKRENFVMGQCDASTRESKKGKGYAELLHQPQQMEIFIPSPNWAALDQTNCLQIKSLYLHEVGHALGLEAHSIFGDDAMFYRCMVDKISARDKEAIRRLYQKNAMVDIENVLHEEAEKDNPYALLRLGHFYHLHGQSAEEYSCYKKAAILNVPEAQAFIGEYYETGHMVKQNSQQAIEWYRRAAEGGFHVAQRHLGHLYENGIGVKLDPMSAFFWYRKAAEQGNSRAEYNLGMCYAAGFGVSKDIALAKKWLSESASFGNIDAQQALQKLDKQTK